MHNFNNLLRFWEGNYQSGLLWQGFTGDSFSDSQEDASQYGGVLPVCPGDVMRVLVPKSFLWGMQPEQIEVSIYDPAVLSHTVIGSLRRQQGELYSEILLSVDAAPIFGGAYRQFALMRRIPNPLYLTDPNINHPQYIEVPVLGTFRIQYWNYEDYMAALILHFESYAHAPVLVLRDGKTLRIRIFESDRFLLERTEGEVWRVGLGESIPGDSVNTNTPSLLARLTGPATVIGATDTYTVNVSSDLEEGNVFKLQSKTYTVTRGDKPADVLNALNVPLGKLTVPILTGLSLSALPGVSRLLNSNRPSMDVLYDADNLNGQWRYIVSINADILPGNIYQVSAPGMATSIVTAIATSTAANIAAQFNATNVGGGVMRLLIPAGQVPVITVLTGSQLLANTNNPQLFLSEKTRTPASTIDRYTVYVGGSVVRGNRYVLDSKTYIAKTGDTPQLVSKGLGFSGMPFIYDVPVATVTSAFASTGSSLSEESNLASVRLLTGPIRATPSQCVLEVKIPDPLAEGSYRLALRNRAKTTAAFQDPPPFPILGYSTALRCQRSTAGTSILRYGADAGVFLGMDYAEDGFYQQLRLELYRGGGRQQQTENVYQNLSGISRRAEIRVEERFPLTTTMQPYGYHRALLTALKQPRLQIDFEPYTCISPYKESESVGARQLYQGESELAKPVYDTGYGDGIVSSRGAGLYGCECLRVWLEDSNFARQRLTPRSRPKPGEYNVIVLCPTEQYAVGVYVQGRLVGNGRLTPGRLNRLLRIRIGAQERIDILAKVMMPDTILADTRLTSQEILTVLQTTNEGISRGGDFNNDFNADYSKPLGRFMLNR